MKQSYITRLLTERRELLLRACVSTSSDTITYQQHKQELAEIDRSLEVLTLAQQLLQSHKETILDEQPIGLARMLHNIETVQEAFKV